MDLRPVPRVAVIDGNPSHLAQVSRALGEFYRVNEYADTDLALAAMTIARPDLALVDDAAPPSGGRHLLAQMRRRTELARMPVVLTAPKDHAYLIPSADDVGAQACLAKPFRKTALLQTISKLLNHEVERQWESLPEVQRAALTNTVAVFNSISDVIASGAPPPFEQVRDACAPLVEAVNNNDFKGILNGVKEYDNYSYAHSMRVATLLSLFGHAIGLPVEEQKLLASGGLLHDVGKTAIPLDILNKPGRLDEREFAIMKGHVAASIRYLDAGTDIPKPVITVAAQHHEKLDGSGYPAGLKAGQLNELARMASIVDVFSALTDRRVYKAAMPAETALTLMRDGMAGHLDRHLLDMFRDMLLDAVL